MMEDLVTQLNTLESRLLRMELRLLAMSEELSTALAILNTLEPQVRNATQQTKILYQDLKQRT